MKTPDSGAAPVQLQLGIGSLTKMVDRDSETVYLGRNRICDLRVDSKQASRVHAELTWDRDNFYLTDRSQNGTFVITGEGRSLYLKRGERVSLKGKGLISLGNHKKTTDRWQIRFSCIAERAQAA